MAGILETTQPSFIIPMLFLLLNEELDRKFGLIIIFLLLLLTQCCSFLKFHFFNIFVGLIKNLFICIRRGVIDLEIAIFIEKGLPSFFWYSLESKHLKYSELLEYVAHLHFLFDLLIAISNQSLFRTARTTKKFGTTQS